MKEEQGEIISAMVESIGLSDESVWLEMFLSISTHPGCSTPATAISWADAGLAAYRDRFGGTGGADAGVSHH